MSSLVNAFTAYAVEILKNSGSSKKYAVDKKNWVGNPYSTRHGRSTPSPKTIRINDKE